MLLAWVVAAVGAFALGSAAAGDFTADYSTPGSESKAAATVLEQRFDGRSQYSVDLVWSARDVRDPAVERSADGMLRRAAGLEGIGAAPTAHEAQVSPDGTTAVATLPARPAPRRRAGEHGRGARRARRTIRPPACMRLSAASSSPAWRRLRRRPAR